ncbi:MAG: hypothetical protein QXO70_00885 [Candidatus Pacearchaeota archaeon]
MGNVKITTIKLREETKSRLNKLREYSHESYDELLNKLLEILNFCKINPERARKILYRINLKRLKLKNSGQFSDKELKKKFSL